MIEVACDICAQKYELTDKLYGKQYRCKECDTRFDVTDENAPVEPTSDDDEPGESQWAGVWRGMRGATAGIAIFAACGWMSSLLFRDPWVRPPLVFHAHSTSSRFSRTAAPQPAAPWPSVKTPANSPAPGPVATTPSVAPPAYAAPPPIVDSKPAAPPFTPEPQHFPDPAQRLRELEAWRANRTRPPLPQFDHPPANPAGAPKTLPPTGVPGPPPGFPRRMTPPPNPGAPMGPGIPGNRPGRPPGVP